METYTSEEKRILQRYFTNIDKPIFGLINLPEVVKGALFARYSRTAKSLRRLFLDEFYDPEGFGKSDGSREDNSGIEDHANKLYKRIFLGYGDDSVAQLGSAHVACEGISNLATKIIEHGRLASYLEQSTRYIRYDQKQSGRFKYCTPSEIKCSNLKEQYEIAMDQSFEVYSAVLDQCLSANSEIPRPEEHTSLSWKNTITADACDSARGLLPVGTLSNLGIHASGQAFEYMLIRLFASPLKEVKNIATMLLEELRKIIPAFLTRVDIENRGVEWSKYLGSAKNKLNWLVTDAAGHGGRPPTDRPEVSLIEYTRDPVANLVESIMFEFSGMSHQEIRSSVSAMKEDERLKVIDDYIGSRSNRRHKPGRAFENLQYTFDVISDYGSFRDLQRHRMMNITWQQMDPSSGSTLSSKVLSNPTLFKAYEGVISATGKVYSELRNHLGIEVAQYVLPFCTNVRYRMQMNGRAAMHMIELRSQKQGHETYRKVSHMMAERIRRVGHDFFANAMKFVDFEQVEWSRSGAEVANEKKKSKTLSQ